MMRILLSNDDGIYADGIKALHRELSKIGKVWVVAPLEERSTAGHSLTLHKPLRLIEARGAGKGYYGVNGSPADCVYLGIRQLLGGLPDLVVSGINRGANMGQDIYYSGTVSAAREACILGIPAIAVSLAVDFSAALNENKLNYSTAAKTAVKIIRDFKKHQTQWPKHTLLNVNVPDVPISKLKGIQISKQGFRFYSGSILKRKDHRGKPYYWVGGQYQGFRDEEGTDCNVVGRGFASITPLKLDCTDFQFFARLSADWPQGSKPKKVRAK